ncbi:hypothetical protein M409DRAFT_60156 [Zasmidium cellare ATCC 36951]|uniref:Uncharacterized protein n=1 Tax=Zasmidium cellare ATCC 36951 TaxID=1080233 RepID=A0A6A6BZM4_ZASCE|nr:uncharacterized protein M409DRAFT_60156 [Zasmidium cellare ATCC 36951]KAF2160244.1 hypothetical protein M409DRAFT_60156 [Zasmidium cellare ATCC 36951]
MTSIFTSDDIASLVANFEPVSLFQDRPSLVKSNSGDSLVRVDKALAKLEHLLDQGQERIEKACATLLGVQDGTEETVFERLSRPLYESKNGRWLMPTSETDNILETLKRRADETFVDLFTFSSEWDIALDSLRKLIEVEKWRDYKEFSDSFRSFICTSEVAATVKIQLRDAIGSSGTEICDLPAAVADEVPLLALRRLASEVASDMGGEVRLEGDHIVYVPANYTAAVEGRLKQMRDERIAELVQHLEDHGYCIVYPQATDESGSAFESEEETAELIKRRYGKGKPDDVNVQIITVVDGARKTTKSIQAEGETKVLATPAALDQELNAMKSAVSCHAVNVWRQGERALTAAAVIKSLTPDDFSVARKSELAKLLFRSVYAKELESVVRKQLEDLEREEHEKLAQLVEARLAIPLQLYTAGIDGVGDSTLKQHLEDFLADHFRREVIPQTIQAAREQKLLRERAKEKDIEKFKQICSETNTFADLQSAVAKLSRKLKLDAPSPVMVQKVKLKTLQTAAKSMQKMTRGSDVLQNLIWILLAQQSQGMFMSSGKDTSRMIKHYETTGSAETAAKLTQWRDALKAGRETKDDLQNMRDLAKVTVEAMTGPERKSSERKSSVSSRSPEGRKSLASAQSPGGRRKSSSTTTPAEWQP